MKKLRKFLSVLLCFTLIFCICSCGKDEKKEKELEIKDPLKDVSDSGEIIENSGDLSSSEPQVLTVATSLSFPPFEYISDSGAVIGIDIEIAQLIADKLGMELDVVCIEYDEIVRGVADGKYDLGAAALIPTQARLEIADCSVTYYKNTQCIVLKDGTEINSAEDLQEYVIGVQMNTTGEIYIESDGVGQAVNSYPSAVQAMKALQGDEIDCLVIDENVAENLVEEYSGTYISDIKYAEDEYVLFVSKENTELKNKVNEILNQLIADGEIDKIVEKYMK